MATTPMMELPEFIYFSPSASNDVAPSRVYHTHNCNERIRSANKVAATEENIALIHNLGFHVCATCKLRYEKAQKAAEHAAAIEAYGIASLDVPPEFELRVYWHRDKGQPVEIWNSKTGLRA